VLQNELAKRLPAEFIAGLPSGDGITIAYAAIPRVASLEEPLRTQVRAAFAESIRVIWLVLVAVSAAGLLSTMLMKDVPMQGKMDEKWAVTGEKNRGTLATDDTATPVKDERGTPVAGDNLTAE
jgi:hypothetical protein